MVVESQAIKEILQALRHPLPNGKVRYIISLTQAQIAFVRELLEEQLKLTDNQE
jgi:hypothetical protein